MRIAAMCGPNDVWYEKTENGLINWKGQGNKNDQNKMCFLIIKSSFFIFKSMPLKSFSMVLKTETFFFFYVL